MSEGADHPRKKPKGKPVEFSRASLKDFVTGFAKRKQQRREYGAIQLAKKQRLERNAARKLRRDAMKITDRLTGAFGEKHHDDSDNELGEEAQNPEDFEMEQQEKKQAEKAMKRNAQNRHEDEEAVVTVVTRENDSEDEDEDDMSDEDDDILDGIDVDAALRPKQASSTPYNPSKSHVVSALHKAKQTLKAKDKMHRKGIKGGHAFKKPKITSKKKKIKFGHKKGANRDR